MIRPPLVESRGVRLQARRDQKSEQSLPHDQTQSETVQRHRHANHLSKIAAQRVRFGSQDQKVR